MSNLVDDSRAGLVLAAAPLVPQALPEAWSAATVAALLRGYALMLEGEAARVRHHCQVGDGDGALHLRLMAVKVKAETLAAVMQSASDGGRSLLVATPVVRAKP